MHLKNYSLLETSDGMRLFSAYDLVSTLLVIPNDLEDSALTINGKKTKLQKDDFAALVHSLQIPPKVRETIFHKAANSLNAMRGVVQTGFLPIAMQNKLNSVLEIRTELFRT